MDGVTPSLVVFTLIGLAVYLVAVYLSKTDK